MKSRSNRDKRAAVARLLDDPKSSAWTTSKIAARAGVSRNLVFMMRLERKPGRRKKKPGAAAAATAAAGLSEADVGRIARAVVKALVEAMNRGLAP